MKLTIQFTSFRQHAIILAALRHAQANPGALTEHLSYNDQAATDADEIDQLAQHFNCETTTTPAK